MFCCNCCLICFVPQHSLKTSPCIQTPSRAKPLFHISLPRYSELPPDSLSWLSLIRDCSLYPLANATHIHWFLGPVSFLGLHSQNISPFHSNFSISFLFLCLSFLSSLFPPSCIHLFSLQPQYSSGSSISANCHFLWWLQNSIPVLPILGFCPLCKSHFSPHMLLLPVQPAGSPQKGLRSVS